MRTGHYTSIPNEPHYSVINHADRLTATEEAKLKLLIIKQKLDISLTESIVSSPIASEHMVRQLALFQHGRRHLRPKISTIFLTWLLIFLMFTLPIGIAYQFSDQSQNQYISAWIEYLTQTTSLSHDILQHILFGDYGMLSLGTYSLVWALPVVILINLSIAVIDQTGFKSWVIWTIEPSMLRMGLRGNDVVPLLERLGCSAATISQAAHQCRTCTKIQCMSLIGFGSSCSYQTGTILSISSVARKSWLFMPYLILVLLGDILHNRIWLRKNDQRLSVPLPYNRQSHMPSIRQMSLQVQQSIQVFIVQALPILITICLIVSVLSLTPILGVLSQISTPILSLLDISSELSPGILFSMIRKDDMLLLNLHQGALLQGMIATQLLLPVFFSSTFIACSVTMTMLLKHLGGQSTLRLIGKQMVTSLSLVIGIGIIVRIVMLII